MKKIEIVVLLLVAMLFTMPIFLIISSPNFSFVSLLIVLIMDVMVWIFVISMIVRKIKKSLIEKNGNEKIGKYVSCKAGMTVNGTTRYFINYVWKDDNGELKEGVSLDTYPMDEVRMFENAVTFRIKVYKNSSAIATKPFELHQTKTVEKKEVLCEYCNSIIGPNDTKCPNCGANRKALDNF